MEAVRADNLSKRFGSFWAVKGVSFTVQEGEIFGFLGPNGAGKSTTIKLLCGIIAPSFGRGLVGGYDVGREPAKVKSVLGYMSQRFSLYDDLTVQENIDFYSGIYRLPEAERRRRKTWVLRMAGLTGREGRLPRELSGGWRQRLALGCALLHQPRILFLDEPTAGVDPISRRRFWDLIADLSSQGTTVFVTTHYMDEAEHCHRLAMINRGELRALGSPEALKQSFVKSDIWELEAEPHQAALKALQTASGIQQVTPFGSLIRIGLPPSSSPRLIEDVCRRARVSPVRLEKVPPSLEEVFAALSSEAP
jgi:ABC-2 type transport system ATP-binding protein